MTSVGLAQQINGFRCDQDITGLLGYVFEVLERTTQPASFFSRLSGRTAKS